MIAIAHTFDIPRRLIEAELRNLRENVEGPFRTVRGEDHEDRQWRFYRMEPGLETAYAAGRLAARRGATFLLMLGRGWAAEELIEQTGTEPWQFVMPHEVFDLSPLASLQNLCPDGVERLPAPLPEGFPWQARRTAMPRGEPEFRLGSMPIPLTVPLLAREAYRHARIGLFDGSASGFLDGAAEAGVPAAVSLWLRGAARGGWQPADEALEERRARESALGEVLRDAGLGVSAGGSASIENGMRGY